MSKELCRGKSFHKVFGEAHCSVATKETRINGLPENTIWKAYTGWPRKNATTLIINFKDIGNKTDLFFILLGRKFIFQQNDTMTTNLGEAFGY